jgi:fructose-1,6-bisphosphatase-3
MTQPDEPHTRFSEEELTALRPLQRQFPTIDSALSELARLAAESTLPMGTVHVISDIHGENVKLRHIINNASGMLRPFIERTFADRLTPAQMQEFLALVFYPRETLERLDPILQDLEARRTFCRRVLRHLFEVVHLLARRYPLSRAIQVFPEAYRDLFLEMLTGPESEHSPAYYEALIDTLLHHKRVLQVVRLTVRVVRNLAVDELLIAGDCWDRGPRGDRVVDYLEQQPNLSFIWGNHDAAWLGACLGQEALIAHVLRISARYRRFSQLEEGYGITLQPLEHLVRTIYKDDPASCYVPRGEGLRDRLTMARMQKAAAMMQFKLEGQTIDRNPEWDLQGRRLLHRINHQAGTIEVDGKTYPLRDTHFPTLDPAHPYDLSPEERACMARQRQSFLASQKLWDHMNFLVEHGSMYLCRDDNLIFHGCVPVDEHGQFEALVVGGRPYRGRALFDALDDVLARVPERPTDKDRDLMWYLWCGPRSPLFGKDRIATLENDLIAEPATHVETKNPYFQLIHDADFCDRILREFGVRTDRGLIVNGHVPVKIEKGESPLKRSGKAITIDGAFSQAYGDHGYTLVLEPEQTLLAKHHHFDSVEAAVRDGVDIIPTVSVLRQWEPPRRVADTERGREIRRASALLERLIEAYRSNQLRQAAGPRGPRSGI